MLMLKNIGIYNRLINTIGRSVRFNSSGKSSLNWVEYLNLKKQNNRLNVASSVFTSVAGVFVTLTYLGNIEIQVDKPIMGLDPLMVMGGAVILGGGVGYLFGPFIGTALFNLKNRAAMHQFKIKDQIFLQKIKHHRVDPSSQSFSNPVPDYYGERIYSLKGYKQWLRDCNAFKRKTKEFL